MRVWLKDLFVRSMPPHIVERTRELANLVPGRLRYGKDYADALKLLIESQSWDEKAFRKYQENILELLIPHCYQNVPYYRRTFDERGLKVNDIQSIEDLGKLPLLSKQDLRRLGKDLLAKDIPFFRLGRTATSGSTGSPVTLYIDATARAFERALTIFHLMWLDWTPSDKIAYMNPRPGPDPSRRRAALAASNELRLTFRAMDEERMSATADLLQEFKPDIISAWPSSLYLLARWMTRRGRKLQSPRFLVTSSENLYPHVRDFVEDFYQARLIDFYGQEEGVAFAMQCQYAKLYHFQALLSIPELLHVNEDLYEVVGTSLHNAAMPLLRFRTGDLAQLSDSDCPCGRPFASIRSVDGRESDFIVTPERKVISPLILNYCFHSLDEVRQSQIIQEDERTLRVVVAPWERLSDKITETLAQSLRDALESDSMRIIVEQVAALPQSPGCKTPFIVSRVDLKDSLARPI